MNENPMSSRETQSDSSPTARDVTTPGAARVLAPPSGAPRAEEAAPFSREQENAARFDDELSLAGAPTENAAPTFQENAARFENGFPSAFSSAENAAPTFDAAASNDFSSPNAPQFPAPQNDFPSPDAAQFPAPQNTFAPLNDTRSTAPQNFDAFHSAPQNLAADSASTGGPPENTVANFAENAPHSDDAGAEDTASTRSARSGVAALILKVSPRILTALVGIPLVLLIVWQGGALLTGITVLLALTAMRELIVAARKNKTPLVIEWCYFLLLFAMIALWNTVPLWREIYSAGVTMSTPPFVSLLHLAWPLLALLLVPVWLLLWGVFRYAKKRVTLSSIALSTLAINYVALFAFWPLLRDLPNGFALFALLLGGVWAGDSAAYFAGRALGKTRLTLLSPGKTREGIVASCAATLLICLLLAGALQIDWRHGGAIGVLIAVFAPLGDLVESLWKRELGVKDLGAILPGHGGVLDRCDSLLLTAPIVFLYALWQGL